LSPEHNRILCAPLSLARAGPIHTYTPLNTLAGNTRRRRPWHPPLFHTLNQTSFERLASPPPLLTPAAARRPIGAKSNRVHSPPIVMADGSERRGTLSLAAPGGAAPPVHWLPCKIDYSGPANVETYFVVTEPAAAAASTSSDAAAAAGVHA
jgi:hypothetical protein